MEKEIVQQLHKRPHPKYKLYNHFNIDKVNQEHQCDLLFITTDKGYKYVLTVVDVASRFKAARPLKNKKSETVRDALIDIYKKDMKPPNRIRTDEGSEFKSAFRKYLKENDIDHSTNQPTHHLPFVEAYNGELAKLIFIEQQEQEIKTKKLNTKWVDNLQSYVDELNNRTNEMTKLKPINAYKRKTVKQKENNHTEEDMSKFHPKGTTVRYLLNNDEIVDTLNNRTVEKRRKTDIRWSIDLYKVAMVLNPTNGIQMHKLEPIDGAKKNIHLYTYWQLQPL